MAILITHRRMAGGQNHEHIASVKWRSLDGAKVGQNTREEIIEWMEGPEKGKAHVSDGARKVDVGIVRESGKRPYLRTHADGRWTNNLLALPQF